VVRALLIAALLATIGGTNCGPAPGASASPGPSMSTSAEAQQAIAQALADAASRTGVESDRWRLLEVAAQEWPDTGLGCPEPGKLYAQVLTPGYLIRLEAGGRILEYHAGAGRVAYCEG
jgi:hypothetical protein